MSVAANAQVEKKKPTCSIYAFNKRILTLRSLAMSKALEAGVYIIVISTSLTHAMRALNHVSLYANIDSHQNARAYQAALIAWL